MWIEIEEGLIDIFKGFYVVISKEGWYYLLFNLIGWILLSLV